MKVIRRTMPQSPPPEPLSVHDLQALAAEAATVSPPPAGRARSRAANLHLIDMLSRWSGAGLAIFVAAAIFIAIVIARDFPMRAGLWAAMLLAALLLGHRYRKQFRAGDKIASRPFRWRAQYTSTLAVVSAAFGAGAFILAVPAASVAARLEIIGVLILGALAAASFHSAHRLSAIAALLPASVFIIGAMLRIEGLSLGSVAVAAILAIGVIALWAASGLIGDTAERKFPRTGLVRREINRAAPAEPAETGLAKAAAKG